MAYNLLSCSGWDAGSVGSWVGSGSCIKAKLGVVILFFIVAIIRKWGGEEVGMDFSFLLGLVGGLGSYLVVVTIFGSFKLAMGIGFLGALILGYGGGQIFGGGEEY